MSDLKDKVVLVSGAGRGIGRGIAERFLAEGSQVVAADVDQAAAATLCEGQHGERVLPLEVDVGDSASVEAMMRVVDRELGRLDVLVNNAGILIFKLVEDLTDDDWRRVMKVNLDGTFHCCRAAARRMKAQRAGAIVNIASLSAVIGSQERGAYTASKAGVVGLTRVLAAELGPYGVRTNAILPGTIETQLGDGALDQELLAAFLDRTPERRRGKPSEIASAAVFLASAESSYVNGHSLMVDGGYLHAGLMLDENGRPR